MGGAGAGFLFFGMIFGGLLLGRKRAVLSALLVITTGVILVSCGGGGGGVPPSTSSTEVSVTRSSLDPATTYFWKVVAKDTSGNTKDSEVRSFTTQ